MKRQTLNGGETTAHCGLCGRTPCETWCVNATFPANARAAYQERERTEAIESQLNGGWFRFENKVTR